MRLNDSSDVFGPDVDRPIPVCGICGGLARRRHPEEGSAYVLACDLHYDRSIVWTTAKEEE